jgi:hypothetical protein
MKKIIVETLGSDPEFFVVNNQGEPAILIGKIGGSKQDPLPISDGISIQEDGVSMEFCIPPIQSEEKWVEALNKCKEIGNTIAANFDCKLGIASSMLFDKDELEKYPTACEFGCSVSYNGWTLEHTSVPPASKVGGLRTTGFHIHFGISDMRSNNDDFVPTVSALSRICDVFLGIPSILVDEDTRRRAIYGSPADFRFKDISNNIMLFEYRCLGGGLLANDETIRWVYRQAYKAVDYFNQCVDNPLLLEEINNCQEEIIQIIAKNNKKLAEAFCTKFKIELPYENTVLRVA